MQAQVRWGVINGKEGLRLSQSTAFPVAYRLFPVTAHPPETWTTYREMTIPQGNTPADYLLSQGTLK